MASTYSNTGIELIADGEQSSTWGQTTNLNWQIAEELTTGVVSVALSATTYTLTTSDGASSEGRHAVVEFTGSPGGACTVTVSPNTMQKLYWIVNNSDETVTITQGTGGDVDVAAGATKIMYCDGAGAGAEVVELSSGGGGGATGGGSDQVFFENDQNVTTDYTITSGKNALTTGPITIASGVSVTVPTGSVLAIL